MNCRKLHTITTCAIILTLLGCSKDEMELTKEQKALMNKIENINSMASISDDIDFIFSTRKRVESATFEV